MVDLPSSFNHAIVDGIPVVWGEQTASASTDKVALWLPPFTQTKESVIPMLQELVARGFVAVSLDPTQHGERCTESLDGLVARVFRPGNVRRSMWPILGQTVIDARRVIDWVVENVNAEPTTIVAGGLSMGGDAAVALAGVDRRVDRVAAIVATPDWTRPGMRVVEEPYGLVDQGEADSYSEWFYNEFDPFSHLDRYQRDCAITLECAENDQHVPPDGALRFRDDLQLLSGACQVRVNLHPDYGHGDGSARIFVENCLEWLSR